MSSLRLFGDANTLEEPWHLQNASTNTNYNSESMASSLSSSATGNIPGGKVPIPRASVRPQHHSRRRVTRACEACRYRKIKCDGIRTTCSQCEENRISCVYSDRKTLRDKKRLEHLSRKMEEYKALLQGLSATVDDHSASKIRTALEVYDLPSLFILEC